MTLYSPEYQSLLQTYHAQRPTWGTSGHTIASCIRQLISDQHFTSVLDYGCGDGSLRRAIMHDPPACLTRFDEYDPGVISKETCPDRMYDLVVCRDVLEHVEPEYLSVVISHLYILTNKMCWCQIAYIPAPAILPDGRNAHLSLYTPYEWAQRLAQHDWAVIMEDEDHQHCWIQCEKMAFFEKEKNFT